jgi:hypothetical protein
MSASVFKFKLDVTSVKGRTKSYDEGLTCFVTEECFNNLTVEFRKTGILPQLFSHIIKIYKIQS